MRLRHAGSSTDTTVTETATTLTPDDATIKFQSCDGAQYIVRHSVASHCRTVRHLLDGAPAVRQHTLGSSSFALDGNTVLIRQENRIVARISEGGRNEHSITVEFPEIWSSALESIIKFLNIPRNDVDALALFERELVMDPRFSQTSSNLALAALLLDVPEFADFMSMVLAQTLTGKSKAQLRAKWGFAGIRQGISTPGKSNGNGKDTDSTLVATQRGAPARAGDEQQRIHRASASEKHTPHHQHQEQPQKDMETGKENGHAHGGPGTNEGSDAASWLSQIKATIHREHLADADGSHGTRSSPASPKRRGRASLHSNSASKPAMTPEEALRTIKAHPELFPGAEKWDARNTASPHTQPNTQPPTALTPPTIEEEVRALQRRLQQHRANANSVSSSAGRTVHKGGHPRARHQHAHNNAPTATTTATATNNSILDEKAIDALVSFIDGEENSKKRKKKRKPKKKRKSLDDSAKQSEERIDTRVDDEEGKEDAQGEQGNVVSRSCPTKDDRTKVFYTEEQGFREAPSSTSQGSKGLDRYSDKTSADQSTRDTEEASDDALPLFDEAMFDDEDAVAALLSSIIEAHDSRLQDHTTSMTSPTSPSPEEPFPQEETSFARDGHVEPPHLAACKQPAVEEDGEAATSADHGSGNHSSSHPPAEDADKPTIEVPQSMLDEISRNLHQRRVEALRKLTLLDANEIEWGTEDGADESDDDAFDNDSIDFESELAGFRMRMGDFDL